MKILIIVPAYNEEKSIAKVITDLRKHGYNNVALVDDGSKDSTAEIAKKLGVKVLKHVLNRGLGAALGTGLEYARRNNFDLAVTFDADGQHQADDIAKLIDPIISGQADVVIGSRLLGRRNMPVERRVLNFLSNILTFFFFGVFSTDSQSGLRAFSQKAVGSIKIKTDRMEVSSEFFKEIRDNNLRLKEVPIKAIYTAYGIISSKQENFAAVKIPWRLFLRLFR